MLTPAEEPEEIVALLSKNFHKPAILSSMQFLTDFVILIISSYLVFANFLALKVDTFLTSIGDSVFLSEDNSNDSAEHHLSSLPTNFGVGDISDILLKNQEYQQAAVAQSDINRTITNPLSALVNIFCTFTTPTTIRTTTGTGFFIHSNGIILTNAHVAQYLLLQETELLGEAECLIRTGNPAQAEYKAELLYMSPTWVQKNAALINSQVPTGTGERDYSLLYVTSSVTNTPLPARFPALAVDTELLPITVKNTQVQAIGYPATDLLQNGAHAPLLPKNATTTISELYTFGSNYADVFSVKGSSVGAEGSSGGPIVNNQGRVIGMIVTRGDDSLDGTGSLRAITISHIHRTILEETGFSLERNLSGNLEHRSSVFTKTLAPFLLELLHLELDR